MYCLEIYPELFYLYTKFVNMRELIEQRIAELDKRMAELKAIRPTVTDPAEIDKIVEEQISIAQLTNSLLRSIGAPEESMYDI